MHTMKRQNQRGGSALEFALVAITLVPMILGTSVFGINMIKIEQTEQVSHEAGRLFAAGVDLSQPGNQTLLTTIGNDVGLSTTSSQSNAVLILSALTYVDVATCAAAGHVDSNGNPSGCTNYGQWVFTIRLTIGNPSIRSSSLGSPLTGGPTGVTVNSDGTIPLDQYVTEAGAVATFSSINPYSNVGGNASGLPSGQFLYIAEAAANTFQMAPFTNLGSTYAFGIF